MSDSLVLETLPPPDPPGHGMSYHIGPQSISNSSVIPERIRKAPVSAEVLHVLHNRPLCELLLKFEFGNYREHIKHACLLLFVVAPDMPI
jgi:hypothetical protein